MSNSNIYATQYTPLDSMFSKGIFCSEIIYIELLLQEAGCSKIQTIKKPLQYHDVTLRVSFFKIVLTLYNFVLDH